jgi:hypothetical protein
MASLPGGTVTFRFTDIEGSTRLLQQLGDDYGNGGKPKKSPDTLRGTLVGLVELLLVVLTILAIIWLIRHIL